MDGIRQWAFSVCSAMVACGIAGLVLPRGNLEKMFRLTVSVFFLCCLLSPVILPSSSLNISVREHSQEDIRSRADRLTEATQDQAGEFAVRSLEKIIAAKLDEMGIKYGDITINISTSGQSEGWVETVEIILDRQHEPRHAQILQSLEDAFELQFRLGYRKLEGEEE